MVKLTETRIEIADRHTALYHLAGINPPVDASLTLGDEVGYCDLYTKVTQAGRMPFAPKSGAAAILNKLLPVDKSRRLWTRYADGKLLPDNVWPYAIPLLASLNRRVSVIAPDNFTAKIKPLPQIFLFPFGWSTWISLHVTGEHTIAQLRALSDHLFTRKAFQLSGEAAPLSLQKLLGVIADGVRSDAFAGGSKGDLQSEETIALTTVFAKSGGSPALSALDQAQQNELMAIARPGLPFSRPFSAFQWNPNDTLNYVVINGMGRLIWMERLLPPEGSNHYRLGLYHENSLAGMVQAWNYEGLLQAAAGAANHTTRLKELVDQAQERLKDPQRKMPFATASVKAFLLGLP